MDNETFLKIMGIIAKMQFEIEQIMGRITLSSEQINRIEKAMEEVNKSLESDTLHPCRLRMLDGHIDIVPVADGTGTMDRQEEE